MAASTAAAIFLGRSGQGYIRNLFSVDAAGALDRWDGSAVASATSPDNWEVPEDCWLVNYIQTGATTATIRSIMRNNVPTGDTLRCAMFIPSATVIEKPVLNIFFPKGSKVGIYALA